MSQEDYNIGNQSFPGFRADLNNNLGAIATNNSGATEPTTTFPYMIWADTTDNIIKQRNATNSAWIDLYKFGSAEIVYRDYIGSSIASAATVDLSTATGKTVTVTGNTGPITSFGTLDAGFNFTIVFSSTPVITHNATSLILPSGANITAAAGDVMELVSLGSGNWRATNYTRADGTSLVGGGGGKVLQVLQGSKIDTQTGSPGAGVFTVVSGFSVPITPQNLANKVLITGFVNAASSVGAGGGSGDTDICIVRLKRNGTLIGNGAVAGSRTTCVSSGGSTDTRTGGTSIPIAFLDSPGATSLLTYTVEVAPLTDDSFFINRGRTDTDASDSGRGACHLLATEIGA